MRRITVQRPSTGKPINRYMVNVGTAFETILEAPDFSVPDAAGQFDERDPNDDSRAIRPGEIFILAPLAVRNKTSDSVKVEAIVVAEDGTQIMVPGEVSVPPGDTAFLPTQGRSLTKRDPSSSAGEQIQIRAETSGALDAWGSIEERLSAEHIGVE